MSNPDIEVMRQWLADSAPGAAVASWAGILDEVFNLYLEALDLTIDEPFQTFAFLEDEEHEEAVNGIVWEDRPLRAGPKARFRRFRAATQDAAKLSRPGGMKDPTPDVGQPAAEAKPGVKVNLSLIIQGSDVKIDILSREVLDDYHKNYKTRMGRAPGVEREPTDEQITCFAYQANEAGNINADFAVFVPYGGRLAKRLRMHGERLGPDGKIYTVEIFGPP